MKALNTRVKSVHLAESIANESFLVKERHNGELYFRNAIGQNMHNNRKGLNLKQRDHLIVFVVAWLRDWPKVFTE